MRAQRLPLCFHIRNISVNCCQPEAKRKERDADMVLLSVDVGYFQAGWQIKMMRALKKITMWLNIFKEVFSVKEKQEPVTCYLLQISCSFKREISVSALCSKDNFRVETMLLAANITLKNKCFYPVQDFLFLLIFFPFFLKQADIHVAR